MIDKNFINFYDLMKLKSNHDFYKKFDVLYGVFLAVFRSVGKLLRQERRIEIFDKLKINFKIK